MTRFILHGGNAEADCENNSQFYQEIFDLDKDEVNFLIISFARPLGEWSMPAAKKEKIINLNENKKINFVDATRENFLEELATADSVYIQGGDTEQLRGVLINFPDLNTLFNSKIIAGSSAGFLVLAKYYYGDLPDICDGLNILPIKALSHYGLPNMYNNDFEKELISLKQYQPEENLETIALRETEFIIRDIWTNYLT